MLARDDVELPAAERLDRLPSLSAEFAFLDRDERTAMFAGAAGKVVEDRRFGRGIEAHPRRRLLDLRRKRTFAARAGQPPVDSPEVAEVGHTAISVPDAGAKSPSQVKREPPPSETANASPVAKSSESAV